MSLSVSVPPLVHPIAQSPSPRSALSASPPLSPSPPLQAAVLASSVAPVAETAPMDPPSPGLEVRMEQRKQMQSLYEKEQHEANNNASVVAHEYRTEHPEIVQQFTTAYAWQVHVFLPTAAPVADANTAMSMASAYGKEAQIHQLTACFMRLGIEEEHVFWHAVTIHNAAHVCDTVSKFRDSLEASQRHIAPQDKRLLVVLNMCDGLDSDGYPGISVIKALESHKLRYTGGNPAFYHWTTDKLDIKKRLIEANVSTSPYAVLHAHYTDTETATALEQMGCGYPMVLKPAVSYASAGITVVWSAEQAIKEAARLRKEFGVVYAEMFIQGREFTVLVTGDEPTGIEVYDAAERCFDDKLPWHKQLLTFDLYWAVGKGPDDKPDYFYRRAPDADQAYLKEVARAAYSAVYGSGYGRVDMRMDSRTGRLYVLEANANCGFSESSDSSMGSILINCKRTLAEMVERCFEFAVKRFDYQSTHQLAASI